MRCTSEEEFKSSLVAWDVGVHPMLQVLGVTKIGSSN